MRRLCLISLICLSLWLPGQVARGRADLLEGQRGGGLTFSGTLSAADRLYLGLSRPGEFTLAEVKARYLLLDFFSDSCPHCILQAPIVNRLFRLLEADPRLSPGTLKLVGLGYYCTPAQLEKWRQKHAVPFPLIPDPQGRLARTLDIPGTPTYVLLDSQGRVLYLFAREIKNPARFKRRLISRLER